MLLAFSISSIAKYFNYAFDGFVVLFSLIYFLVGFKRGILRTLWAFLFDLIAIAAAVVVAKYACPLFVDKIPAVGAGLIPHEGIAFAYASFFSLFITCLVAFIVFFIARCVIFKKVLRRLKERDYTYSKKKNFFGRVGAAILTGGLAFMITSGTIVAANKMTGSKIMKNYTTEMSQTYVAKYGEKFMVKLTNLMIRTESIENPHETFVRILTEGECTYSNVPYYRNAAYRLLRANNVNTYLSIVGANTNEGLVNFSEDLHVWAIMADVHGSNAQLDAVVKPIAKEAAKRGYKYTGNVDAIAPFYQYQDVFSAETYSYIVSVLG